jgi:N-acetylglutamate synthase-like GNAT family acetyltransferase
MADKEGLDLAIRPAEVGDAAALADLMTQLGYPTRTSEMEMRMEAICADRSYATFVAIGEGKVCGMIGTSTRYTYEHNGASAVIMVLVVSEKMRGHGVGHALVRAAEEDLAQRSIRRVAVYTHFRRTEAHEFYEQVGYIKNGFRLIKELPMRAD